ncbi:MAG: hypothetical protein ACK5O7_06570 [Holosporales bacterium]
MTLGEAETIVYKQETKVTKHTTNTKVKTTRREDHYYQPMTATGGVVFDIAPGAEVNVKLHARKHTSLSQVLDRMAQDPATSWVAQLRGHPAVDFDLLEEVHKHRSKTKRSLSPAASFVLSLAISLAVPGPFGAVKGMSLQACAQAAGNVAFKGLVASVVTSSTNQLMNGKFDPKVLWRDLSNQENVLNLAVNAVSAGVMQGMGFVPPRGLPSLEGSLRYAAAGNVVRTTLSVATGLTKAKDALRQLPIQVAVDALTQYAARSIGQMYQNGLQAEVAAPGGAAPGGAGGAVAPGGAAGVAAPEGGLPGIGYATHKVLHFLTGFAGGYAKTGNFQTAMTAGVGAAGAEAIAEGLVGNPDDFLEQKLKKVVAADGSITQEQFDLAWDEYTQRAADIARLGVACGALLAKQDVAAAVRAADNALDHNFLMIRLLLGARAAAVLGSGEVVMATHVTSLILTTVYEAEIEATREELIAYVAKKTDLAPAVVELVIDGAINAGSLARVATQGGKQVWKSVAGKGAECALSKIKGPSSAGPKNAGGVGQAQASSSTPAPAPAPNGQKPNGQGDKPKPEKGKEKVTDGGSSRSSHELNPQSATQKLQLQTRLHLQEKGILTQDGRLTEYALKESRVITLQGDIIKNPSVVKTLTQDGSKIEHWAKFKTPSVEVGTGQRMQVHYYKNTKTGKVDYVTQDYKVKGVVNPNHAYKK